MDYLTLIKSSISEEYDELLTRFDQVLRHPDQLLSAVLEHIRTRGGKRMRPVLVLLMAKSIAKVTNVTYDAAMALELLHTASLVHDDVVDESGERRGQASVNALYDNKVAVLVGDFILSTALLRISHTANFSIVRDLAELGRTLSRGEILQLHVAGEEEISREQYFRIIDQKTAALFESCAMLGAKSVNAEQQVIDAAAAFGREIGIMFQIRDDIFDYTTSADIGKPTGQDLDEGKLTLPAICALEKAADQQAYALARKIKKGEITPQEKAAFLRFVIEQGGIEAAEEEILMRKVRCTEFIKQYVKDETVARSLEAYVDYVVDRRL